jgi:TPR repeat protein
MESADKESFGSSAVQQLRALCRPTSPAWLMGNRYRKPYTIDPRVEALVDTGADFAMGRAPSSSFVQAAVLFRKAANRGSVRGQTLLGILYAVPLGMEKNDRLALYWLSRAARQGYPPAQYMMGECYRR